MTYNKLIKLLAAEYNTTPDKVEKEMCAAIRAAGYDMEPEAFIALTAAKVNSEINDMSSISGTMAAVSVSHRTRRCRRRGFPRA